MGSEWRKIRLGDVAQWFSGGTPPKSEEQYWGGSIPWISASSMDGNRYYDSELKVSELGLRNGTPSISFTAGTISMYTPASKTEKSPVWS